MEFTLRVVVFSGQAVHISRPTTSLYSPRTQPLQVLLSVGDGSNPSTQVAEMDKHKQFNCYDISTVCARVKMKSSHIHDDNCLLFN